MVGADDSSLYFVYPHYADDEDGSVEHYGVTIDNTAAHPTIDAAMRSAERHLAKVRAAPPTPPRTPVERGNAEWLASYHAERAGYGGASREFHMRAETWVRDHARPPVERPNEVMAQAIARAASWAEYMLGTMGDVLHIDVKAELKGHRDSMRAALDGIPDWRDRPSGASVEPPATEQYDCPCGAWTLAHAHGWGWMTRRPPGVGEASAFVPGSGWVDLAEHDAAVRAEGVVSALESLTRMGVMSGGQAEALCELLKIPPPNRPRTPAPTPEEPTP